MEGAVAVLSADTGTGETSRQVITSALCRGYLAAAETFPHLSFRSTWVSPGGFAGVGAWSNQDDPPPTLGGTEGGHGVVLGAHTVSEHDRLALTGSSSSLIESVAELGGCLTVFYADQAGITVSSSVIPAHPVFYGEKDGLKAAATRADVVVAALGFEKHVEPTRMHGLVQAGYLLGDATPYRDIQFLNACKSLRFMGHGFDVTEHDVLDRPAALECSDPIETLAERLVEAVRPLGNMTRPVNLALSGGRDSRLIAAALHAAGIKFTATTRGEPSDPDVKIASSVADRLGVNHTVTSRSVAGSALVEVTKIEHPRRRAFRVASITEGATSAWDDVRQPGRWKGSLVLSGIGGEVLRGGYAYSLMEVDQKSAEKKVNNIFGSHLMTTRANDRANAEGIIWLQRVKSDPFIALDRLYLLERLGRWGVARKAAITNNFFFGPFLDNRVLGAALAIPARIRWSERPVASLVERLAPSLADIPLEGRPWRFQRIAYPPTSGVTDDWRRLSDRSLRTIVEEAVCSDSGEEAAQFFELVDEQGLRVAKERNTLTPGKLWNLLTYRTFLKDDLDLRDVPEFHVFRSISS